MGKRVILKMSHYPPVELWRRKSVLALPACLISIILALAASAQPKSPNEQLYSKNKGGDPDADFYAVPIVPEKASESLSLNL